LYWTDAAMNPFERGKFFALSRNTRQNGVPLQGPLIPDCFHGIQRLTMMKKSARRNEPAEIKKTRERLSAQKWPRRLIAFQRYIKLPQCIFQRIDSRNKPFRSSPHSSEGNGGNEEGRAGLNSVSETGSLTPMKFPDQF
jgi:hypothetical protein